MEVFIVLCQLKIKSFQHISKLNVKLKSLNPFPSELQVVDKDWTLVL